MGRGWDLRWKGRGRGRRCDRDWAGGGMARELDVGTLDACG